jgi:lipid-A-disaccharide synthase
MPIFGETLRSLEATVGAFRVAVPTVETVAEQVTAGVRDWPGEPIILRGDAAKYDAFAASRAALAASGTVALELAMAGLPMTVAYRLSRPTEILLERVLKVRQVNLINLILGRPLVAEHLGPFCTPERLAATLVELIRDERVRAAHRDGYDAAVRLLGAGDLSPSLKAADKILEIIAARRQK